MNHSEQQQQFAQNPLGRVQAYGRSELPTDAHDLIAATPVPAERECRTYLFFFFSSRRRHTRCGRDWSSDVCSSDLLAFIKFVPSGKPKINKCKWATRRVKTLRLDKKRSWLKYVNSGKDNKIYEIYKIGRASCRERV